jgi:hypothetical protein
MWLEWEAKFGQKKGYEMAIANNLYRPILMS